MSADLLDSTPRPVFFVSYARARALKGLAGLAQNEVLQTFYADLTANVTQLVATPVGEDPGFIDTAMETGTNWRTEVLRNVGTCQVFVALLSSAYVQTSAWCPMEWDLFTRRKVTRQSPGHGPHPILPVTWAPIAAQLPKQVARVQRFVPNRLPGRVPDAYREHGLLGLYRTDRGAYEAVVWALSLEIQRFYHDYHVEPVMLHDTRGLHRSFAEDWTP